MESTFHGIHQLIHFFQALWYVVLVPLLHPESNSSAASCEIPSAEKPHWTTSIRLTEAALPLVMGGVVRKDPSKGHCGLAAASGIQ